MEGLQLVGNSGGAVGGSKGSFSGRGAGLLSGVPKRGRCERSHSEKHANERKRVQVHKTPQKSAKEHKRAQKSAPAQ